jgi:hypothetical protein
VTGITDTLLADAAAELRGHGFDARIVDFAKSPGKKGTRGRRTGVPWVLAEDAHFLLAVVVATSVSELAAVEPQASSALSQLVEAGNPRSKKWDLYLVLLSTAMPQNADELQVLNDLEHNLRAIRRLVSVGVAGHDEVRMALAPFLPLKPAAGGLEVAALDALRDELVINGVSDSRASQYVAVFREKGSLNGI